MPKSPQARFNWSYLIRLIKRWRQTGTGAFIPFARRTVRYDDRSFAERLEQIFDPQRKSLLKLPVGYFDARIYVLPASRVPDSEDDLVRQCRRLINHSEDRPEDRAKDNLHLELMLKHFPGGWTLEQHAQALWELREVHELLYNDIVRGIHGRAQLIFKRDRPPGLQLNSFKGLLARQGLLLCALDAQMTIIGARIATERPFGDFLTGSSHIVGGTVLRLMRNLLEPIEESEHKYQTLNQIRSHGRVRQKMRKRGDAKLIAHYAKESSWIFASASGGRFRAQTQRRSLDSLRRRLASGKWIGQDEIDKLAKYNLANGINAPKDDNTLRTFNQIWLNDLTSTEATALILLRFAMAEQLMDRLVDYSFGDASNPHTRLVSPIPLPPADLDRQSPLVIRTLDLLDSARRCQLVDSKYKSRTANRDRECAVRDPDDMAGLSIVIAANKYLHRVGGRLSLNCASLGELSDHQANLSLLDVVPDIRLNCIAEPDTSLVG